MLGDAQGPANLRALGFGVSVRGLANHFRGHAALSFRALQRVLLDARAISVESAGRVLNELFVGQACMNNLARHGIGQRNVAANIETQPSVRPLRGTRAARINYMELRAVANPFQQMMEENRMRLARVRAPQKNNVRLFDFAVGTRSAARPENRRQTGDAGGVSSPVAAVNVVRADDRADEFLRDVVQLIGGLRTTEHAKRARPVLFYLRAESRRHAVQRLVPRRRTVFAVLANQRHSQALAVPVVHGLPLTPRHLLCSLVDANFYRVAHHENRLSRLFHIRREKAHSWEE